VEATSEDPASQMLNIVFGLEELLAKLETATRRIRAYESQNFEQYVKAWEAGSRDEAMLYIMKCEVARRLLKLFLTATLALEQVLERLRSSDLTAIAPIADVVFMAKNEVGRATHDFDQDFEKLGGELIKIINKYYSIMAWNDKWNPSQRILEARKILKEAAKRAEQKIAELPKLPEDEYKS